MKARLTIAVAVLGFGCATPLPRTASLELPPGHTGGIRNTTGGLVSIDIVNSGPGFVLSSVDSSRSRQLLIGDSARVRLRGGQVIELENDSPEPVRLEYSATLAADEELEVLTARPLVAE
jgi:hypothetical protein